MICSLDTGPPLSLPGWCPRWLVPGHGGWREGEKSGRAREEVGEGGVVGREGMGRAWSQDIFTSHDHINYFY